MIKRVVHLAAVATVVAATSVGLQPASASAPGDTVSTRQDIATTSSPGAVAQNDRIRSKLNGKCLDIRDFNPNDGAVVQMWSCSTGANQRWHWSGDHIRSKFN